jgi:hypothetical protein
MVRVIPREIREKDLFFKFFPAHRHPIAGSRTSPVEKVGIEIVPHLINMGFPSLSCNQLKAWVASPLSVHSVALTL